MSSTWEFLSRTRRINPRVKRLLRRFIVGCFLLLSVGFIALEFQAVRAVRAARQATFPPISPPASMIACRTGPTVECAIEASRKAGLPVAWLEAPPGYRFQWLAAMGFPDRPAGRRLAFENLVSDRLVLQLDTQPQPNLKIDEDLVGEYTVSQYMVGDVRVQVRVGKPPAAVLTLSWMHAGTSYSLFVAPLHLLEQSPLDPQEFLPLVSQVRYTGHRARGGGPDPAEGPR